MAFKCLMTRCKTREAQTDLEKIRGEGEGAGAWGRVGSGRVPSFRTAKAHCFYTINLLLHLPRERRLILFFLSTVTKALFLNIKGSELFS